MLDEVAVVATGKKSAQAFKNIREVSEELDVPQHVLRFWESKFSEIRPLKRGGRRRYYRPEDVALLRIIEICRMFKDTKFAVFNAYCAKAR